MEGIKLLGYLLVAAGLLAIACEVAEAFGEKNKKGRR